uniref:Uncharacterized protein n=1 Tax=Anopheles atroparvus TaxID=41427 RepID=A0A182IPF0_ANOAO
MVVNSVGAFAPRAVSRSQSFVQNRWNPYASGPAEPLVPGYGFGGPGPGYHPLNHPHPHHHHNHHPSSFHPLVAAADESHGHGMKFTSTAEEYGASAHGGGGGSGVGGGYDYHPPPPPQPPPGPPAIIHQPLPPLWQAPAHGGKGKGKGAALSALTLLAFLYFLNLLQSCLKEHMETMNPTVMVMTAGANRRKYILDRVDSSVEQATGGSGEDEPPRDDESPGPEGAAAAAAAYEQLSHRYQLLTSSNRTRNPFKRPTNRARNKSSAPSRYEGQHGHTGSDDWFDRGGRQSY